jgi:hypothetical protein
MLQPKTRREMEIWSACDGLWAQSGILSAITGDAIREEVLRLGYKKGSPNEIYRYRKTWIDARQVAQLDDESETIAVPDPISRAVQMVHEQLKKESDEVLAALQAEFDESKACAAVEIASLQAERLALQTECTNYKRTNESLECANEELRQRIAAAEANEQLMGERLDTFQSLFELWRTDAAEKHTQMENLFAQVLSEKDVVLNAVKKEGKALAEKYADEIGELKVTIKNLHHQRDESLERQTKSNEKQKALEKELKETIHHLNESQEKHAELSREERRLAQHLAVAVTRGELLEKESSRLLEMLNNGSRNEKTAGEALKKITRDIFSLKRLLTRKRKIRLDKKRQVSRVDFS